MPLALALIALLLLAVPAQANTRAENQRIRSVMPLARVLWGTYECRGREKVTIVPEGRLIDAHGWGGSGAAHKSSCRIWIAKDSARKGYRQHLCDVLTHEVGHLALSGTDEDHRRRDNYGVMMGRRHPLCELA